jgi:hypothetical protein
MTIELIWDPGNVPDLAGYQVGYDKGATSIVVQNIPKVVNALVVEIDLDAGMLHRFWVRRFDIAGNLSSKEYIHNAIQVR